MCSYKCITTSQVAGFSLHIIMSVEKVLVAVMGSPSDHRLSWSSEHLFYLQV